MNNTIRDYRIIKTIGEGGMGTVYLAEDPMLERKVAIKVLNPALITDQQFRERFRQEAKLQASLLHPNIVALYSFFEDNGSYHMVMEYAPGKTLKELIQQTGPIEEQRVRKIMKQILDGVGFAHSKGIVHRDIKPSNIIIDENDNVKIMDFGIAKILGEKGMTKTGAKVGTIYYMSPEQVRAVKDIDHRTDIFSLGITLYEMLSGRLPYNVNTESDFEIMKEIVEKEYVDPRSHYPHISDQMVSIMKQMTEKDRSKRIGSCDAIARLLHGSAKERTNLQVAAAAISQPLPVKSRKMFSTMLSFQGRIGRMEYGLSMIAGYIIYAIIAEKNIWSLPDVVGILYFPLTWFFLAQGSKRCHDMDNSGWYQLIPFYAIVMLFIDGNPGGNTYGPDPKGRLGASGLIIQKSSSSKPLLWALGGFLFIIVLGIVVAVGITMFQDNAVDQNRNMVIADLQTLAAKAQQYYAKPSTLGGGGQSFGGLTNDDDGMAILASKAFSDNVNGTYTIERAGTFRDVMINGRGKTALSDGSFPEYRLAVTASSTTLTKVN